MTSGQMGMGGAGFFYGHPGMTGFPAMPPAPTGASMGGAMGPTQAQQILIPNDMVRLSRSYEHRTTIILEFI
jgi:hypothetical protein